MGKSTISMAIFNSKQYSNKFPEGNHWELTPCDSRCEESAAMDFCGVLTLQPLGAGHDISLSPLGTPKTHIDVENDGFPSNILCGFSTSVLVYKGVYNSL